MGYGVKVPPQDCLLGGPRPISLTQFIEGDGLFPVCVRLLIGEEYPINVMEELPEQLAPLLGASLDNGNEVIQVDIYVGCGGQALLLQELFPSGIILRHQLLWIPLPAPEDVGLLHLAGLSLRCQVRLLSQLTYKRMGCC